MGLLRVLPGLGPGAALAGHRSVPAEVRHAYSISNPMALLLAADVPGYLEPHLVSHGQYAPQGPRPGTSPLPGAGTGKCCRISRSSPLPPVGFLGRQTAVMVTGKAQALLS